MHLSCLNAMSHRGQTTMNTKCRRAQLGSAIKLADTSTTPLPAWQLVDVYKTSEHVQLALVQRSLQPGTAAQVNALECAPWPTRAHAS